MNLQTIFKADCSNAALKSEAPCKSDKPFNLGTSLGKRWLIVCLLALVASLIGAVRSYAQVVVANPLEWAALVEGNELINAQIKNEMDAQTKTALLQNAIAAEFTQMKKWEQKYNSYLKTAEGYASQIKAASHLYNDGVRLFINLCQLKRAIATNPQGIAATLSMNNLYVETAAELVSVYSTLKNAVDTGGKENMLTGAERSQILWSISDQLGAFNRKLTQLTLSLQYYTLNDVWYNATEGIIDRSHGEIASQARSRWMRAARINH